MSIKLDCIVLSLEEMRIKYIGKKVRSTKNGFERTIINIDIGYTCPFIFNSNIILDRYELSITRLEEITNLNLII